MDSLSIRCACYDIWLSMQRHGRPDAVNGVWRRVSV